MGGEVGIGGVKGRGGEGEANNYVRDVQHGRHRDKARTGPRPPKQADDLSLPPLVCPGHSPLSTK